MMNNPLRLILPLLLAALLLPSVGCQRPVSQVEIVSHRDPYFPEPFKVVFDRCAYRTDAGEDCHIAARTVRPDNDPPTAQYLHVHVYWQPRPGRTPANRSTSNALVRYIVATSDGVAEYTGTGFAYPDEQRDGTLEVSLESIYLKLHLLSGELPEPLGDSELNGTLIAKPDPAAAAQIIRECELLHAQEFARP